MVERKLDSEPHECHAKNVWGNPVLSTVSNIANTLSKIKAELTIGLVTQRPWEIL